MATKSSARANMRHCAPRRYSPAIGFADTVKIRESGAVMSVKVVDNKTGKETTGKYAVIKGGQVSLYTGSMSDKKGGWRGCGCRLFFPADSVTVAADEPTKELKQES